MGVTNFTLPLINLLYQFTISALEDTFDKYGGIIRAKNTNCDVYKPVYYIYELNGALNIISRGSAELADYVTDADFNYVNNSYGCYHEGFWKASSYVYKVAKPIIEKFNGPIYFTGHSYGGAVATVLITVARKDFPNKDFNAVAFAPVPALSEELNATHYSKIVSFVNNWDIVPTFSVPNVYQRIKYAFIGKFPRDKIISILDTILNGLEFITQLFSKEIFENIKNALHSIIDILYDYSNGKPYYIRYIPGKCYHIFANKKTKLSENVIDPKQSLNTLSIHFTALSDHLPKNYEKAVANIVAI